MARAEKNVVDKSIDLVMFRSGDAIALTNDEIIIGLFKGTPQPDTIDHISFLVDSMRALRDAVTTLKKSGVNLEDPGEEIGPTSPGSPHMVVSRSGRVSLGVVRSKRCD